MWRRSEDWVGSQIEDGFVMVHVETGRYLALNVTANCVWQALETPRDEAFIVERLRDRFDVEEAHCRRSVATLLAKMQELKLIAPE